MNKIIEFFKNLFCKKKEIPFSIDPIEFEATLKESKEKKAVTKEEVKEESKPVVKKKKRGRPRKKQVKKEEA